MRTSTLLFTIFSFLILVSSCGSFNAEEQALYDEVMKLHDDSMRNHGVMMKNTVQIRQIAKKGNLPANMMEAIKPSLDKIDAADEGMMSWMSDLKGPIKLSGKPHEEIMSYLQSEKIKIEKIDKDIKEQLTVSRNILNLIESQKPAPTQ